MSTLERHLARIRPPLRSLDPRLDRRRGLVRLGVAGCVALTVALGIVYAVEALDRLGDDAATSASANYDDREFGGGNSLVVDKNALYEARGLIPEDESYRVVAGPGVEGATELTEPHIGEYARYFLMPRRPDPDARWVLCYGCDLGAFGDELEIVWRDDLGIAIGRLRG